MNVSNAVATSILVLLSMSWPLIAQARGGELAEPRASQVEAFAKEAAEAVPGMCVLVAYHDQVVYRKAYGLADVQSRVQLTPDCSFRIGSLTKQFTAVAILQLVDQGKLSLDDNLTQYLPNLPTGYGRIKLRHLLGHTSGIPDYTGIPGWPKLAREDRSPKQLLALIRDRPLEFQAGHDWHYSNTNYVILGTIIEKVTGQSFAAYLKTHVFDPAGMTNTAYGDGSNVARRARGYTRAANQWQDADLISISNAYAAGGLTSTVDDLWKWEQSLSSGRLIPRGLLVQARSENRLTDGRRTGYGFGWGVATLDGHATVEHGGRIPGFQSYAIRVGDAGVFVAVLVNTDDEAAKPDRLALRITRTLLDDLTPSLSIAPEDAKQYVGTYMSDGGAAMRFILDGGVLTLDDHGRHWPLTRVADNEFVSKRDVRYFKFKMDGHGHPDKLLVHPRLGVEQLFARNDRFK